MYRQIGSRRERGGEVEGGEVRAKLGVESHYGLSSGFRAGGTFFVTTVHDCNYCTSLSDGYIKG